jgi:hypothetical protein
MIARLSSLIPLEDIAVGARLLWSLQAFLRNPISAEEALATVRRRLEQREADFLEMARRAIYESPGSPYRDLLTLAGCEYGDLERLTQQEGVEGALRLLLRRGVYLTVNELKGRQPVVRGSATLTVAPSQLLNPYSDAQLLKASGGSRGPRTPVPISFAWYRDRAVNTALFFDARGAKGWLHARWAASTSGVLKDLEYCSLETFERPPARLFSQVDPAAPGLHPRYHWGARALRWGSLLAGIRLPRVEIAPLDRPLPIAHWMAKVLRAGRTPHLHTFVSSAAHLCQAALSAGIDLDGAQFTVGGEPVTPARLAAVRQTGAQALPRYGAAESGKIGYGCLAPVAADDLHLMHDLNALIQPGPDGESCGLPPDALLVSSLRPTCPLILFNASMGDRADLVERACGCPLERLGWVTHLHTVRSFEKLTAGGNTFLDTSVIEVLEEMLPARFGGGPTDYQLVEEEADDGRPRLRLLVHPAVGPLDTEQVADAFLSEIGGGSGMERVWELRWRQAGLLQVERQPPLTTGSGKILHLHLGSRAQAGRPPESRSDRRP